jgi:formylglycine-generating enzyme required for sulfatase activity
MTRQPDERARRFLMSSEGSGGLSAKIPGRAGFLALALAMMISGFGCDLLFPPKTPTFSLVYDGNGATSGTAPVDGIEYGNGETVFVLSNSGTLAKIGYEFAGWNSQADGKGADRLGGSTFSMGSRSVLLYANWQDAESLRMVSVPGGSFLMGAPAGTGYSEERPRHTVTVSGFRMGVYEISQELYRSVTGINPSKFIGGAEAMRRPVEQLSRYDAMEFCNGLSIRDGFRPVYTITGRTPLSGYPVLSATVSVDMGRNGYRLPTEAEWEYAAKGGAGSPGGFVYSGSDTAGDVGWYADNSGAATHLVGFKDPNSLGIFDMTGNVTEMCQDWYGPYDSIPRTDPEGPPSGDLCVVRGGSWYFSSLYAASLFRSRVGPEYSGYDQGFRVVRRP